MYKMVDRFIQTDQNSPKPIMKFSISTDNITQVLASLELKVV